MAGNYPDVPGHRMSWDRDGSIGFRINSDNSVTTMTQANRQALNDESDSTRFDTESTGGIWDEWHGVIFPELRDIVGWFIAALITGDFNTGNKEFQTSPDSTNGLDGTWTTRQSSFVSSVQTIPYYRTAIQTGSYSGIKAVKFRIRKTGGAAASLAPVYAFHIYGTIGTGLSPDRLRLWHPTLDQEVGAAYFDWDDVPQGTTADTYFRVKNQSATLTANTITVSREALYDTSPTVVSQHQFEIGGGGFGNTVSISSLAPGAISNVITLRRTTLANAVLSLWAIRIVASAATWT